MSPHPHSPTQVEIFGQQIRSARKAKGFNQAELADAVGTSQGRVSSWENGDDMPSGVNLIKLCAILETGADLSIIPSQNNAFSRLSELREQLSEIRDLLNAIDLIGDGIGGEIGFAVSAVALQARSVAENVAHQIDRMGGGSNG